MMMGARTMSKTLTLDRALQLARGRHSTLLAGLATRVNNIAAFGMLCDSDGGELGQAYRDIDGGLPADRSFSVDEWIAATHEVVEPDGNACGTWMSTLVFDPQPKPRFVVGARVRARKDDRPLGVGRITKIDADGVATVQWTGMVSAGGWRQHDLVPA